MRLKGRQGLQDSGIILSGALPAKGELGRNTWGDGEADLGLGDRHA